VIVHEDVNNCDVSANFLPTYLPYWHHVTIIQDSV